MTAENIIKLLGLKPLETEGGFYCETYVSSETVSARCGSRRFSSAIYYLLRKGEVSAMHRLKSDEVWHFYAGDPVRLLTLSADGSSSLIFLGSGIMSGQRPQAVVLRDTWQGLSLVPGGEFALMGTTVSPAYTQDDFELGDPEKLSKQFPDRSELIKIFL